MKNILLSLSVLVAHSAVAEELVFTDEVLQPPVVNFRIRPSPDNLPREVQQFLWSHCIFSNYSSGPERQEEAEKAVQICRGYGKNMNSKLRQTARNYIHSFYNFDHAEFSKMKENKKIDKKSLPKCETEELMVARYVPSKSEIAQHSWFLLEFLKQNRSDRRIEIACYDEELERITSLNSYEARDNTWIPTDKIEMLYDTETKTEERRYFYYDYNSQAVLILTKKIDYVSQRDSDRKFHYTCSANPEGLDLSNERHDYWNEWIDAGGKIMTPKQISNGESDLKEAYRKVGDTVAIDASELSEHPYFKAMEKKCLQGEQMLWHSDDWAITARIAGFDAELIRYKDSEKTHIGNLEIACVKGKKIMENSYFAFYELSSGKIKAEFTGENRLSYREDGTLFKQCKYHEFIWESFNAIPGLYKAE